MIYLPHRRLAFRVPDQGKLIAWYKGDAGITLNGADVSVQADQKNSYDLTQGTPNDQPLLNSGGLNGMDTIQFDGVTECLEVALVQSQPFTVYVVMKAIAWGSADDVIAFAGGVNGLVQHATTPQLKIYMGVLDCVTAAGTPAIGSWHIITAIANGASSHIQVDKETATIANGGVNAANVIVVGANNTGSSNQSNIEVAEILYYDGAHDGTNRGLAQDYLAARWGLSI